MWIHLKWRQSWDRVETNMHITYSPPLSIKGQYQSCGKYIFRSNSISWQLPLWSVSGSVGGSYRVIQKE